jgi:hypothetical protein
MMHHGFNLIRADNCVARPVSKPRPTNRCKCNALADLPSKALFHDLVRTIAESRVMIRQGDEQTDSPGDNDRLDRRGA